MRKTIVSIAVLFLASLVFGQGRVFVSKVSPSETPVLEDGEIAVGVLPDGEPVQIRYGDGVTPGGLPFYDSRAVVRVSPVATIEDGAFTISLAGSAYWTNGVISLFPPTDETSTNVGYVTLHLASPDQRIKAVRTQDVGRDYALSAKIAANGLSATLTGRPQYIAYPGVHPVMEGYIERFSVDVYTDGESVDATNDLRGLTVLLNHPEPVANATNAADHKAVTIGWYRANVQDAVSLYSGHPALSTLALKAGMTMDDGRNLQERFRMAQKANGYMTLSHESDASRPVMTVEAMDPYPWLINLATGAISTLEFTTNGLTGDFRLQTCTNSIVGQWSDAKTLSTNTAPAGYMSLTGSNTLGGTVVFWRVSVSNAVQAESRVVFGVPVKAPQFKLSETEWLYWSNGLRIHSGSSNGLVNVTWE